MYAGGIGYAKSLEFEGISTANSSRQNASALSTALLSGGSWSLLAPGTYSIYSWPSGVPANTVTYLGPGVTLTDGTASISGPVSVQGGAFQAHSVTLNILGDSIGLGSNASSAPFQWANRVGAYFGWTVSNSAVDGSTLTKGTGGSNLGGQYDEVLERQIAIGDNSAWLAGYNDMREAGPNYALISTIEKFYTGAFAWLAVPESRKQHMWTRAEVQNTAQITFSTPAHWTMYSGRNTHIAGFTSNHDGTTVTWNSLVGDTIYLWYGRQGSGTGAFYITIDGTDYSNVNLSTLDANPLAGQGHEPALLRITGLTYGSHTLKVTNQSAAGIMTLWSAAGIDSSAHMGGNVYIGGPLRMTAAGYAASAGTFDRMSPGAAVAPDTYWYSDSGVERWESMLRRVCETLRADGLQVYYIDLAKHYNPQGMVGGDNVHPGDIGHNQIACGMISGILAADRRR